MKYLITTIAAVVLVGCGESKRAVLQPDERVPEKTQQQTLLANDLSTEVLEASLEGKIELVQEFLEEGGNINSRSSFQQSLLHMADSVEMAEFLIKEGADVNSTDMAGDTPLSLAIRRSGNKDFVNLLVANNADINAQNDFFKNSPLHEASQRGYVEIVEILISNGADVNAKNGEGKTPMDLAVGNHASEALALLQKNGGKHGSIHSAAHAGNIEAVQTFLASGVDVNASDKKKTTPLHFATLSGQMGVVEMLHSNGANIDAKADDEQYGWTPLHIALHKGRNAIAEFLIKNGADVNAEADKYIFDFGFTLLHRGTPLHIAARNGNHKITKLLISKGAKVSVKDMSKSTPLIYACQLSRDKTTVELLIANGANINSKGWLGKTALHRAAHDEEVAGLLIAAGADVNARDDDGATPLDLAIEWEEPEAANFLRKHGAKKASEL